MLPSVGLRNGPGTIAPLVLAKTVLHGGFSPGVWAVKAPFCRIIDQNFIAYGAIVSDFPHVFAEDLVSRYGYQPILIVGPGEISGSRNQKWSGSFMEDQAS